VKISEGYQSEGYQSEGYQELVNRKTKDWAAWTPQKTGW
jgi:hypothetical protein